MVNGIDHPATFVSIYEFRSWSARSAGCEHASAAGPLVSFGGIGANNPGDSSRVVVVWKLL